MLARSYKVLGSPVDAAEAFSHGGLVLENDLHCWSDYAPRCVRASRGKFDSKTDERAQAGAQAELDEAQALFLAGAAAEQVLVSRSPEEMD